MVSSSKNLPNKLESTRIQPLFYLQLKSDGSNYLKWSTTTSLHLIVQVCIGTIEMLTPKYVTPEQKAWLLLFLQKHIDQALQNQYVLEENPAVLWSTLASCFSQERRLHLPGAQLD